MYFYKVLVASNKYHGNEALTYASTTTLKRGQTVLVPLRSARVSAVVISTDTEPTFKVKQILSIQIALPLPEENLKLLEWLAAYYPANASTLISLFVPSNLKLTVNEQPKPLTQPTLEASNLPALTKQQTAALTQLQTAKTALIHGDTGTGKTRIYLELAKKKIIAGQSVVVLTPEIGLTSQLAQFLTSNIAAPVIVLHSNLTAAQRRKLWQQIQGADGPLVIVGPRSALFAPIKDIGLVVVDEAHDNAYKQDQSPYYHALRVAGKLAQIHDAQLIFGTATPLVSEYFILETKKIPILRLTEIAAGNAAPAEITVIDAHDRTGYTKNPYLSDALIESLAQKLKNKEQSLVFLNRRGTARLVMCQKCNWQALCPRCSLPLTYHSDSHSMRCHTCGYKEVAPTICPICSSTEVVYKSIGTKALTTMLQSIFPDAQIQRFDTDNAQDEKLERHYDSVLAGNVDILVGTQILVKGLDLPKLSLVGIIAADSSLYFPDYTAEEQTYQLLSQVIGRVGRGHRQSNVVIQTYNTSGKSLNAVLDKNWIEFYQQQLSERRQYFFPPFCYVMKLSCSRKTQASAMKNAQALVEKLKTSGLRIEVTGPSPRFIEQTNGNYNWQIIVKATQRIELIKALSLLPANWTYNLDPTNLL